MPTKVRRSGKVARVSRQRRTPAKTKANKRARKAAPIARRPLRARTATPKRAAPPAPAAKRVRTATARNNGKPVAARPAVPAPASCLESSCGNPATVRGFCRLHYIKNWKAIKARERRAVRKRLHSFEEELIHKVPVDYEERAEALHPAAQRSLDIDMARAREDVEEMFREMGFEEDLT